MRLWEVPLLEYGSGDQKLRPLAHMPGSAQQVSSICRACASIGIEREQRSGPESDGPPKRLFQVVAFSDGGDAEVAG